MKYTDSSHYSCQQRKLCFDGGFNSGLPQYINVAYSDWIYRFWLCFVLWHALLMISTTDLTLQPISSVEYSQVMLHRPRSSLRVDMPDRTPTTTPRPPDARASRRRKDLEEKVSSSGAKRQLYPRKSANNKKHHKPATGRLYLNEENQVLEIHDHGVMVNVEIKSVKEKFVKLLQQSEDGTKMRTPLGQRQGPNSPISSARPRVKALFEAHNQRTRDRQLRQISVRLTPQKPQATPSSSYGNKPTPIKTPSKAKPKLSRLIRTCGAPCISKGITSSFCEQSCIDDDSTVLYGSHSTTSTSSTGAPPLHPRRQKTYMVGYTATGNEVYRCRPCPEVYRHRTTERCHQFNEATSIWNTHDEYYFRPGDSSSELPTGDYPGTRDCAMWDSGTVYDSDVASMRSVRLNLEDVSQITKDATINVDPNESEDYPLNSTFDYPLHSTFNTIASRDISSIVSDIDNKENVDPESSSFPELPSATHDSPMKAREFTRHGNYAKVPSYIRKRKIKMIAETLNSPRANEQKPSVSVTSPYHTSDGFCSSECTDGSPKSSDLEVSDDDGKPLKRQTGIARLHNESDDMSKKFPVGLSESDIRHDIEQKNLTLRSTCPHLENLSRCSVGHVTSDEPSEMSTLLSDNRCAYSSAKNNMTRTIRQHLDNTLCDDSNSTLDCADYTLLDNSSRQGPSGASMLSTSSSTSQEPTDSNFNLIKCHSKQQFISSNRIKALCSDTYILPVGPPPGIRPEPIGSDSGFSTYGSNADDKNSRCRSRNYRETPTYQHVNHQSPTSRKLADKQKRMLAKRMKHFRNESFNSGNSTLQTLALL